MKTRQSRHATAIRLSTDGYAALDFHGHFLEVNDALCALTGRSREVLLGLEVQDVLRVESGDSVEDRLARAKAAGHASFEGLIELWETPTAFVSVSLAHPQAGGEDEIHLFMHDITERKRREQAFEASIAENRRARETLLSVLEDQAEIQGSLRETEERFRGILDNNVAAMFMIEEGRISYCNRRAAHILGEEPAALLGRVAAEFVAPEDRPRLAALRQEMQSGGRNFAEAEFRLVRTDGAVVEIGGSATRATLQGKAVILAAAQDIGERKKAQIEIQSYIGRLEKSVQSTLEAVAHMVELRDPYTSGHERRVGELAAAIGEEMGLAEHSVRGLRLTGFVHDIGKISAPAELLVKPTRLTPIEYELIKGHSQAGYDVLKNVDFPWPVAETILQHHERLDGSGYPRGLEGEAILLEARIIAVADVVEAMASHRPYRPALGVEPALAEIEKGAGKTYDPAVAAACVRLFREKGYALPP
ncbi:MAG: HD domain-containing phosphohydrolase [Burkholderiales bacterium]